MNPAVGRETFKDPRNRHFSCHVGFIINYFILRRSSTPGEVTRHLEIRGNGPSGLRKWGFNDPNEIRKITSVPSWRNSVWDAAKNNANSNRNNESRCITKNMIFFKLTRRCNTDSILFRYNFEVNEAHTPHTHTKKLLNLTK